MLRKGDFHIHSTASDGKLSPRDIVLIARNKGLDVIAITDHNSTSGIEEAITAGRQYGVSIIPGVEISTKHGNESIHLLGYFRDHIYNEDIFQYVLKLIRNDKAQRIRSLLKIPKNIESRGSSLSVSEGIYILRMFHAAVVLAHPVRINQRHLQELLSLPFDGIEAKYFLNNEYDTEYFTSIAQERFPFYTGGSDFHSNRKKRSSHGLIGFPSLNAIEIQMFLNNSGVLVL